VIIAFSGIKFSGKDTAAEGLIRFHKFKRIGLADKLKDICSEVFNISRHDMDNPEMKESLFETAISLGPTHIDSLLKTLLRDGYDFEFDDTREFLCKNFMDKKLTSIREVLQVVGTDICRTYVKDDIWLEYIKNTIINYNGNIVVTDARFKNERDFLRTIGAVTILVIRPGYENKSSHVSENQLGTEDEYDVIVNNNSSIVELQSNIALWYTVKRDALNSKNQRRV
jgi:hypothetical protein